MHFQTDEKDYPNGAYFTPWTVLARLTILHHGPGLQVWLIYTMDRAAASCKVTSLLLWWLLRFFPLYDYVIELWYFLFIFLFSKFHTLKWLLCKFVAQKFSHPKFNTMDSKIYCKTSINHFASQIFSLFCLIVTMVIFQYCNSRNLISFSLFCPIRWLKFEYGKYTIWKGKK